MIIGVAGALVPGIPLIPLLVDIQVLNGLPLPVILGFMLVLASNKTTSTRASGHAKRARSKSDHSSASFRPNEPLSHTLDGCVGNRV
jgi:Mn2+/Fe2+ NRAMP family transporter